jgi:hypothetical protein
VLIGSDYGAHGMGTQPTDDPRSMHSLQAGHAITMPLAIGDLRAQRRAVHRSDEPPR